MKDSTVPIGEFRAKCFRLLDEVRTQGVSLTITKRGRPIAKVVRVAAQQKSLRGSWKGLVKIKGDIVHFQEDSWEANE